MQVKQSKVTVDFYSVSSRTCLRCATASRTSALITASQPVQPGTSITLHCETTGYGLAYHAMWWKYSGLVLCKSWGNSGVTASTSRHWKPQESSMCRWFHIAGKCHTGHGVALPECGGGASVWGVGLAGRRFLCAGKYIAPLIEHEWSGPQHPAHGEHKGSWMVGYLCSCTGCAVTRHRVQ